MKIIVDNLGVEYRDEGAGAPLVFLHGWQDDLRTFDALAARLSPAHRVIRLDLPGFGGSETPREAWGVGEYAEFVGDFMEKLAIHPDVLVGHSFGGRIIMKGIAEKRLAARKIILIASAGVAPRKRYYRTIMTIAAKAAKIVAHLPPLHLWKEKLRRKAYRALGSDYANAGRLSQTFVKVVSEDLSESARKLAVPALLIWGSRDAITPLSEGKYLASLIPDSILKVVDGTGHFVHREKPDEVTALIKKFV